MHTSLSLGMAAYLSIWDTPDSSTHGQEIIADKGLAVALLLYVLVKAHVAVLLCMLRL